MAILAIESALDVTVTFGDTELVKIYQEALEEAGVHYESSAKCWA
jgi:hypothetical protein